MRPTTGLSVSFALPWRWGGEQFALSDIRPRGTPFGVLAGTKTNADGTRNWSAISADAIARGVVIGGCALADFVESYLAQAKPRVASKVSNDDGAQARQTFEHFRATQAGGATFKTRLGTQ